MADNYIDQDEISIYGPHASGGISQHVVGLLGPFDDGLRYLVTRLDNLTATVEKAVAAARAAAEQTHRGSTEKAPALVEGRDLLTRFRKHLDAHSQGSVYVRRFFTKDGTATGAKRGGAKKVENALEHIAAELKKKDSGVKDASSWQKEIGDVLGRLSPAMARTDNARASRRTMTPEVEKARNEWLKMYAACKSVVKAILDLAGRPELMPEVFHDLTVNTRASIATSPQPAANSNSAKPVATEAARPAEPATPAAPAAPTTSTEPAPAPQAANTEKSVA